MSDGFDFLGFRIRWKRKRGTNKWYVYTFIADRPVRSLKAKIRALTHKTSQWDLASVLTRLGQIMRGWANYFKHAVAKTHLQQTGRLHMLETRPHAAGTPRLELGTAPPPPDRPHRAVADRGGRDRVLPDREGDGLPLHLPGQQDPHPLATHEPRLTADTVESPLPRDRHAGFGERPGETDRWQHRHRAPGRLNMRGRRAGVTALPFSSTDGHVRSKTVPTPAGRSCAIAPARPPDPVVISLGSMSGRKRVVDHANCCLAPIPRRCFGSWPTRR